VVALVVTGILLVKVVPQFAETFQSFGADLPAFTLFVLGLSDFMQKWWFIILASLVAVVLRLPEARLRSVSFAEAIDKFMLKAADLWQHRPRRGGRALFAHPGHDLQRRCPARRRPRVHRRSVGQRGLRQGHHAHPRRRDDRLHAVQLRQGDGLFPNMLLQMVSIGEESGQLDEMLDKVANHYEEAVDNAVDSLSSLMEPMIMSILGVLVGGLMVAMYLPIFMLGSVI
jgi:type IV pilus assembly protein PilC